MAMEKRYDVAIIGAGLAGLSLARQLLLETDGTVLLMDRRAEIPPAQQKVGESTVQVGAYYLARVLDMEEVLFRNHYMKYNLRFYWKSPGRENRGFEDYSQAYIRNFSNIACYQLDRNTFEAELLRRNREDRRFTFLPAATDAAAELAEDGGPHRLTFQHGGEPTSIEAGWVVDTTGRARFLARRLDLRRQNAIHHGAAWAWVDGLVDIEKLTGRSWRQVRLDPARRATGHLPLWLATNHFMGEGFWFWVIPLQGKTSLGLVYDRRLLSFDQVSSGEKLLAWAAREFPLFADDFARRRLLGFGGFEDFSHGCAQTISPQRWALSGESGRFLDPLYSPGSDFIAFHNTLIVDAIRCQNPAELAGRCRLHEQLMRAFYEALIPAYTTSYDALGDQETFVLKYTWELAIYFAFFVFPFMNELLTDRRGALAFLQRFAPLGPLNHNLQAFLSGYYQWKKAGGGAGPEPLYFDFTDLAPLKGAADTFYEVGVTVEEARQVLSRQLESFEELARYILAYLSSVVVADGAALTHRGFIEGIDPTDYPFDPEAIRRRWAARGPAGEPYEWSFDPWVMEPFRQARHQAAREGGPADRESREAGAPPAVAAAAGSQGGTP